MRIVYFFIFFSSIILMQFSCKSDNFTPLRKVWYSVEVPDTTFFFKVIYYNDWFYFSEQLDTITLSPQSPNLQDKFWHAERLQQNSRDEEYFITLFFDELLPFEGVKKVYVFANDSVVLDSASYSALSNSVLLHGTIPKILP